MRASDVATRAHEPRRVLLPVRPACAPGRPGIGQVPVIEGEWAPPPSLRGGSATDPTVAASLDVVSMFGLGIVGIGHCAGMCGPLVLALPSGYGSLRPHFLYHLGRVSTYTLTGAVIGGAGALLRAAGGAAATTPAAVARVQLIFSLAAALVLVFFGLVRLGVAKEPRWMATVSPARLPGFRRVQLSAMQRGGGGSLILFGALLGFLPCGLTYAAFGRVLSVNGSVAGATLMLAFGLGTLPGLLLLGRLGSGIARRHAKLFDVLSGVLLVGMAASLLVDAVVALQ